MTDPIPGAGPWRPDPRFFAPELLEAALVRRVLPFVTSPARYIGGEPGLDREGFAPDGVNVLLGFPDAYEVGMSHQGIRILHDRLRRLDGVYCDVAFTPWPDMERRMREIGLPLFGLASRRALTRFDLVGFSLGYELAYTNLLTMIDLAGSPLLAVDRGQDDPIYVAGGSCTMNPSVVGPFLDVLFPGDGEDVIVEAAAVIAAWKREGGSREDLVAALADLPGAWRSGRSDKVRVRTVKDLNQYPPPRQWVPTIEPVHDRISLEVMRGCVRGCRFCQAGMITRPVRERDPAAVVEAAVSGVAEGGFAEVSLLSLSTADYSGLADTVAGIQGELADGRTNLVLPSLRVDSVSADLYERISRNRPANFTFAPEAGSQRLRDVINKQITEEDIVQAAGQAFDSGVKGVKLYFMSGLPTETNEDLDDLVALVGRIVGLAPRGGAQIHVSVSPFAPKAHTPFQWAGQISRDEIRRRNQYLAKRLQRLRVKVSLREPEVSFLEAVLGLGDEKLAPVVRAAWQAGARFDGWSETFDFGRWEQAFAAVGVDPETYTAPRDPESDLPWDTIDTGVEKAFLQRDWKQALRGQTLVDCRLENKCSRCGVCDDELQHVHAPTGPEAAPDAGANVKPSSGAKELEFDPRNEDPGRPGEEAPRWRIWRQQAAAKCWYRLEFSKTGEMAFLGHLDFQRQMQLALRRSGLPAAYSKGYHPHPLMKFGPPLPVGIIGLRENLDLALEAQVPDLAERLNAALPEGLLIRRTLVVGGQTPASIDQGVRKSIYRVELPGSGAPEGPSRETVKSAVNAFLASESWPAVRRRPKGDIQIDARALVPEGGLHVHPDIAEDGGSILHVELRRDERVSTLPINVFLTALLGEALPEPGLCAVTRLGDYGRSTDGRWLTPLEEVGETCRRFWLSRHLIA